MPSTVSDQFTIGTGIGSIDASSNLPRALSVQVYAMAEYMIVNGQDLSE